MPNSDDTNDVISNVGQTITVLIVLYFFGYGTFNAIKAFQSKTALNCQKIELKADYQGETYFIKKNFCKDENGGWERWVYHENREYLLFEAEIDGQRLVFGSVQRVNNTKEEE